MFKGQRYNPKKGVEAHSGVDGKVGVSERRRQMATEMVIEVWLYHTPRVAVLVKASMIWHERQSSLSVFISRIGRQNRRAILSLPFHPSFHLSRFFLSRVTPTRSGENTRLACLSQTGEDIMHCYWLPANPYQVFIRHPIRRFLAETKSRLPPLHRKFLSLLRSLVRHSL